MNKRISGLLLVVLMALASTTPVHANDRKGHDEHMSAILFGDTPTKNAEALEMLEAASYLAVDQYNSNGQSDLDLLTSKWIIGIPNSIDAIDFTSNATHRNHTHRGWDFTEYAKYNENDDKAHWKTRKNILLATVNKVFGFGLFSGLMRKYNEKCNSFAALVYYIHILGDHIEDEDKFVASGETERKATNLVIPIARDHPGETNPDMIWELEKHLKVLFDTSTNKSAYGNLEMALKEFRERAGVDSSRTAGVSSNAYAEELLGILKDSVPGLLKKEDFFVSIFYPDRR